MSPSDNELSSGLSSELSDLHSQASSEEGLSDLEDYREDWDTSLPWFASSGARGKLHWRGPSIPGDPEDSCRGRWPCTTFLSPSAVNQSGEGIAAANASGVPVWCASCRRSLLKVFPAAQGYLA